MSNVHNYISMYSQVSPIKEIRGGYEVLIIKEGTAISLHSNSGFMGIQERTSVSNKNTRNGKREGKYEIKL